MTASSQHYLNQHLNELEALDTHIGSLEEQLRIARTQRAELIHRIQTAQALQAPIRRVPNELLCIIFEQNSNEQRERNYTLMRVCKLWKILTMYTPRLWSNIALKIEDLESLPLHWFYIRDCLNRSDSVPLHIIIDASQLGSKESAFYWMDMAYDTLPAYKHEGRLQELANAIEESEADFSIFESALLMTLNILRGEGDIHLSRWETLRIEASNDLDDYATTNLWSSINGATRNLASLTFMCPQNIEHTYRGIGGFPVTTALRSLSTNLDVAFDQIDLPVSRLERLHLLSAGASSHFLQMASSRFQWLRELALRTNEDWLDDPVIVEFPVLEAFIVSGPQFPEIMDWLRVPKLTHLCISPVHVATYSTFPILPTVTDILCTGWFLPESPAFIISLVTSSPCLLRLHFHSNVKPPWVMAIEKKIEEISTQEGRGIKIIQSLAEWPYFSPYV